MGRWDLRRCREESCPVRMSCERWWLRFDKTRFYIDRVFPSKKGCEFWTARRGPQKKKGDGDGVTSFDSDNSGVSR